MRGARMPVAVWPSAFPLAITTERDQVLRRLYQLFGVIENDDVSYLFWCRFANASEQVEKEWRTAPEKKGLAFIHSIPLEDPWQAQPPDELSSLRFKDVYLTILNISTPSDSPSNDPS